MKKSVQKFEIHVYLYIVQISVDVIEIIQKINALICFIVQACTSFRESHKLSNGTRAWTTILQDTFIRTVKLNGENQLQKIQPIITEQLFTITKFLLRDR